jgi:alanine dehydrogenase
VVPYLLEIGELGIEGALKANQALARGLYMHKQSLVKKNIAERFGLDYKEFVVV